MKKKLILFYFAIITLFAFTNSMNAQCSVKITSPENGSHVDSDGLVSGTVNLPANGYLWVFSHKVGFNGWWPQGNGAAQIIGNEWDVLVYFGVKGDYGKFEVIALVVDSQTNQDLEKWVREAPNTTPPYQPIALPTSIDGCAFGRVRVEKTKD
jgi:hypothetical protein